MKFRFLRVSFTCLVIFLSLVSFTPSANQALVRDVLTETNKFRKAQGLPVLVINEQLSALAQKHSANMASGNSGFGHGGFSTRNNQARKAIPSMSAFAENVAFGSVSAKDIVKGWKKSPGHRRNMLGRYKYIGIGVARDRRGRYYYTQVFAG